jgi:fatty acid desaturase
VKPASGFGPEFEAVRTTMQASIDKAQGQLDELKVSMARAKRRERVAAAAAGFCAVAAAALWMVVGWRWLPPVWEFLAGALLGWGVAKVFWMRVAAKVNLK